ncbi:MAG: DNA polymerase III subunit delta' [Dehalococcoidia bacterium]|nr:DNA polymerase III subunit delta' [Dehalococcoidia bacterium]
MWQIIGQSKIVSLLQRSIEHGSLAHAYLLVGPAHVGKMRLATDLAQALNCKAPEPPCDKCESCRRIASGKHADIQVIYLGQNQAEESKQRAEISIEQVKDMLHTANLPPFEGEYKVYIIDQAEQMSNEAANRLLKTLEEPPAKVLFLLLTANDKLLPTTIVSRCQRLELSRLATGEVESALARRNGIDPAKARLLARLSHGCLGWAIAATKDASMLQQRADRLNQLIEMASAGYVWRFDVAGQLAFQFSKKRETVYELLDEWLGWWRDVMLIKTDCRDAVVNIDFMNTLVDMAQSYSLVQIKDIIGAIRSAGEQLKLNANARLVLEVLMLNIPRINRIEVKHG